MRVAKETRCIVDMDFSEGARLARSLGRVLQQIDKIPPENYSRLVSLGDIDQLLALKTALGNLGDRQ